MQSMMSRQRGMTTVGWLVIAVFSAVFVMAGIRLVPVYITSQTLSSVMRSVAADVPADDLGQVRRALDRHLQVNDVRVVNARDFEVERVEGKRVLVLEYEHRVTFIGNVDFVVSFDKRQEMRRQ
jgi:hypothetical protein